VTCRLRPAASDMNEVVDGAVIYAQADVVFEYLGDLARHFSSGLIHLDHWTAMCDSEIIAELTAVRGIGQWTAGAKS